VEQRRDDAAKGRAVAGDHVVARAEEDPPPLGRESSDTLGCDLEQEHVGRELYSA
jgi:hypothetical protein